MYLDLITANYFKRMPWKNGKGETTELFAKRDSQTNQLIFRLSIASVTVDGNFSDFSGFQRTLIMISGNGIILSHQGQQTQELTQQYQYCRFDGGWQTAAKLINGPITDFNVICNSQTACSKVSVLSDGESKNLDSGADDLFLFAHKQAGRCRLSPYKIASVVDIPQGSLLHLANTDMAKITASGNGLICVQIYDQ
ncbi:MAG: environmental stress-induced protein Ves [Arenicella sp.]|jgi:environmental stress-induced protein Ves